MKRFGWKECTLGDICKDIFAGGDVPKVVFSKEKTEKCCVPVFSNGVENDGLYGFTDIPRVVEPCVTISGRGTIGHTVLRSTPFFPIIRLIAAIPKDDVDIRYFYYAVSNIRFKSTGVTIPQLTVPAVKSYRICYPVDKSVQLHIVDELDLLSRVIEQKKAQLRTLDELAQSIFYEMFGEILSNEKRWDASTVGNEFKVCSGGTPDTKQPAYWVNGNISWIGSNLCQNHVLYHNDGKFITKEGLSHSSAKLFSENFVLVALVGATIGKSALLRFKTTTNQNVAGIDVPSNEHYTSEFVYMMMRNLYPLFMNVSNGKFKMANLSFVRSLPIIKPPLSLQETFSERFSAVQQQKSNVEKSIVAAENLLASRMDKYFNE